MHNCLQVLRLERELTQAALAHKLGKSITTICRWETGRLQMSLSSILHAAKVLGVAPSAIYPMLCEIEPAQEEVAHAG